MGIYAKRDNARNCGAFEVDELKARRLNAEGYGIFETVNQFPYDCRSADNLEKLNAWYVDIDGGNKPNILKRFKQHLKPSLIVETKNGFQARWNALDATIGNYREIQFGRLIPLFKADDRAADVSRLLRAPGYYHMKDPANPFLCSVVYANPQNVYSEEEMLRYFKPLRMVESNTPSEQVYESDRLTTYPTGLVFEDFLANLDNGDALLRISGHDLIHGENITLVPQKNGNMNVYINGKSTSCFINQSKKIMGAVKGCNGTVLNWLRWYKHDDDVLIGLIKEVYNVRG